MTKKSFVIILISSVIVTYVATFIDALINNTLLGGKAGFPLKFSSATLFGEGTTNYLLMGLNVFFWFIVIFIIWKLFPKLPKKK